jgi:hypothetical protein
MEAVLSALALAPDGLPGPALAAIAGEPHKPLVPFRFALLQ